MTPKHILLAQTLPYYSSACEMPASEAECLKWPSEEVVDKTVSNAYPA